MWGYDSDEKTAEDWQLEICPSISDLNQCPKPANINDPGDDPSK